jgi:hypothetical protein
MVLGLTVLSSVFRKKARFILPVNDERLSQNKAFRSDSEDEQKWAAHEYTTVVLDRQEPINAKPSGSEAELAGAVIAALLQLWRE